MQAAFLDRPVAAVLAGGRGTRINGSKAIVPLDDRPLISYPIAAARAAGLQVVLVAKRETTLPTLAARVLYEPAHPRHPFAGIVTALRRFGAVVAIPCDMPFLTPELLRALAAADGSAAAPAVDGQIEPFPSLYTPACLPILIRALEEEAPVRATVAELRPTVIPLPDVRQLFSVNTPADLVEAGRRMRSLRL